MRYLIPFFALLTLVACGGSDAPTSELEAEQLSGPVRLDGSSTVFPISEAVAEEYLTEAPRVRVTVGVSGTGGGFKKFLNEEIDINAASRPIKESEFEQANEKGIQVLEIPVAFDGLSVGSYPWFKPGQFGTAVVVSSKNRDNVFQAAEMVAKLVREDGYEATILDEGQD